jgi:hypothetical protein
MKATLSFNRGQHKNETKTDVKDNHGRVGKGVLIETRQTRIRKKCIAWSGSERSFEGEFGKLALKQLGVIKMASGALVHTREELFFTVKGSICTLRELQEYELSKCCWPL